MTAPTSITARIGSALGDAPWSPVAGAVAAVLERHRPLRIYDDCGHQPHEAGPNGGIPEGMVELEGIGLVCERGYRYSICLECCTGRDGFQSELCAMDHHHVGEFVQSRLAESSSMPEGYRGACWPCPTVRAIAEALGVQP